MMEYKFKSLLLVFVCFSVSIRAQVMVCSWNIQNFGKSKSDVEIEFIANILKGYDAVAIIEVVAGYGGSKAVAKLSDILNRKGAKWDYVVSDPTTSVAHGKERYAFLWKTSKLKKIGDSWLEKRYSDEIEREPFYVSFKSGNKIFTLAVFHAVPKLKHPENEIQFLPYILKEYPDKNIVFCGDYNCPQSSVAFQPLKSLGYKPIFTNQKTTLRNKCLANDCLASEFDNIFYCSSKTKYIQSGIVPFYIDFTTIKEAKIISDHVPIFFQFSLN